VPDRTPGSAAGEFFPGIGSVWHPVVRERATRVRGENDTLRAGVRRIGRPPDLTLRRGSAVPAPEKHDVIETLVRLLRAPQERTARVREVIYRRWRRELRRARRRFLLIVVAFVLFAALVVTLTLHWLGSRVP
jgi:hypothetical protein